MTYRIYTAEGCVRCRVTKRFMQGRGLDFEEIDIRGEGKEHFARFYRENRGAVYRGEDGVEFPVLTDGGRIRQGLGGVIGYLVGGDALDGFIGRSGLHGEWVDGFDVSGGDPGRADALLEVLHFLKQNAFRIQAAASGRNAAVMEQILDRQLADRMVMEVKGPCALYGALSGAEIAADELTRSIALAARFPEYRFFTTVAPVERQDGTLDYLSAEEIGETARMIAEATGAKKHPYELRSFDPLAAPEGPLRGLAPLPPEAMFKRRTAARQYMVLADIRK